MSSGTVAVSKNHHAPRFDRIMTMQSDRAIAKMPSFSGLGGGSHATSAPTQRRLSIANDRATKARSLFKILTYFVCVVYALVSISVYVFRVNYGNMEIPEEGGLDAGVYTPLPSASSVRASVMVAYPFYGLDSLSAPTLGAHVVQELSNLMNVPVGTIRLDKVEPDYLFTTTTGPGTDPLDPFYLATGAHVNESALFNSSFVMSRVLFFVQDLPVGLTILQQGVGGAPDVFDYLRVLGNELMTQQPTGTPTPLPGAFPVLIPPPPVPVPEPPPLPEGPGPFSRASPPPTTSPPVPTTPTPVAAGISTQIAGVLASEFGKRIDFHTLRRHCRGRYVYECDYDPTAFRRNLALRGRKPLDDTIVYVAASGSILLGVCACAFFVRWAQSRS